jgi:hypothetical protein
MNRLLRVLLVLLAAAAALVVVGCGDDDDDDHEGNPFDDDSVDDDTADDDAADDDTADDDTAGEDLPQWLLDRPYLQDRSAWAQDIDLNHAPLIRQLGPVGVGNGKVFGLLGNQYPLASWHNLGGPTYQKDLKWFTDKVPYLWGGGRPRTAQRTAISYVRHTPVVIISADDNELEWTSVNFAPRGDGTDSTQDALISVWIVRNISEHFVGNIWLEMNGWFATFRDGGLMESDLNGRFLYLRPLDADAMQGDRVNVMRVLFDGLEAGAERVVILPLVFVEGEGDPAPVFDAIADPGVDPLLEATVA